MSEIRPFTISIAQDQLDDLSNRLTNARLPQSIEGIGWERGVPVSYLKTLIDYWHHTFDWRSQEAILNNYSQFTTEIDGQHIHFFHIKSEHTNAKPLLLLHGWPSSSIEYLKLIEPLTNPKKGDLAFHLIIPTIPGFGLSGPVTETGWQSPRTAKAYATLMDRLGYDKYGAHGTDIGADILGELVKQDGNHLIGAHYSNDISTIVFSAAMFMGTDPSQSPGLLDEERAQIKQVQLGGKDGSGYFAIQSTKPQTIGYGFTDSPVLQLAWLVEKYKFWTNPADELPEDKIDLNQMLTNISLYWFMESGITAANYMYENMHAKRSWGAPNNIPTGYAVFNTESFARKLLDPEHRAKHWTEFKEGQHFPAMETPELLAQDLRKFFTRL